MKEPEIPELISDPKRMRRLAAYGATLIAASSLHQSDAHRWAVEAFGADAVHSPEERAIRLLEEAGELAQALGVTQETAWDTMSYVYTRPVGEVRQEVGGVMTTLAVLCQTVGINYGYEAVLEMNRIDTPEMKAKCAAKQAAKNAAGMTAQGRTETRKA